MAAHMDDERWAGERSIYPFPFRSSRFSLSCPRHCRTLWVVRRECNRFDFGVSVCVCPIDVAHNHIEIIDRSIQAILMCTRGHGAANQYQRIVSLCSRFVLFGCWSCWIHTVSGSGAIWFQCAPGWLCVCVGVFSLFPRRFSHLFDRVDRCYCVHWCACVRAGTHATLPASSAFPSISLLLLRMVSSVDAAHLSFSSISTEWSVSSCACCVRVCVSARLRSPACKTMVTSTTVPSERHDERTSKGAAHAAWRARKNNNRTLFTSQSIFTRRSGCAECLFFPSCFRLSALQALEDRSTNNSRQLATEIMD